MILYPGMLVCFSTNHSLHFASEQDTSGLHLKHEVANLYLLHFTVDKDFVLVVLPIDCGGLDPLLGVQGQSDFGLFM